ncbi:squalene/phytoene synthase family protein [Streptomyces sp. MS2A]|nr:squalene/phytoene synthase family protein [Streptomyces sp. MS2A]
MTATGLSLYDRAATDSASVVIRRYSTSFAWASRLLPVGVRTHISRIYALVRVADELVDGPAADAGVGREDRRRLVDDLEAETAQAIDRGFSTNLVVHAFALTAREHRIGADLYGPFFAAMRTDTEEVALDAEGLRSYVHGSAEVVGLMCLAVFEGGRPRSDEERGILRDGAARLGAAFQNVNFLRDYAADRGELGRRYVLGAERGLTEEAKAAALARIRDDLRAADAAIPLLDPSCRPAVWAARTLFGELATRLERTPAALVARQRVRVPDPVKAGILVRALARRAR